MIINHNMQSINAHRQMGINATSQSKSTEKLSSGLRINRAGDDAAGLAISEKMRGQIRGLDQATRNAQDGISLIQTAEGALTETHSILQRMRELSVQSANDTNTTTDREEIQKEIEQLTSEINRIGNTTQFNEKNLLDGSLSSNKVVDPGEVKILDGAKAGEYQPVTSAGVTNAKGVEGEITFTNTDQIDWSTVDATKNTNKLDITKNADGSLKLSLDVETSKGKFTIDAENITADKDGNFNIDAHGIKLTLSKEEADKLAAGEKIEINLNQGKTTGTNALTSVGLTSDYTASTNGGEQIGKVTVAEGSLVTDLKVEYDGTDKFTVTLTTADGQTITEELKQATGGDPFKYDGHGVSFEITPGGTAGADDAFELNLDLKDKLGEAQIEQVVKEQTTEDKSLSFQIGANKDQSMSVGIEDIRANALGLTGKAGDNGFTVKNNVTDGTDNKTVEASLDVTTASNANNAIEVIDKAIQKVSGERSKLGAAQNRLEHTINNLGTSSENLTAAESRIRDVDMAKEMMNFTKTNVLNQAAQAMLSQANQLPNQVLQLLR